MRCRDPYLLYRAMIPEEREIQLEATIRSFRIVRQEGVRRATREDHYSLPAIVAVGFRVRSAVEHPSDPRPPRPQRRAMVQLAPLFPRIPVYHGRCPLCSNP